MEIKILVEAYCPTVDDVEVLCSRFWDNYSYFSDEFEETEYEYNEETGDVRVVWSGDACYDFDEEDEDDLLRLTHHAEGLYEDSDIEHTHVEVFVNGEWHGR